MKVTSVEQMRQMDSRAVKEYAIPEEILMENAGIAAYTVLLAETGIEQKCFVVVCATGNNGGDGLVVARKLHSMGATVQVYIVGDKSNFKGAAQQNLAMITKTGVPVIQCTKAETLTRALGLCDVVVDALFGTGLARAVEGVYLDIIQCINASGKKVLSLDIPSGIHGDTGKVMGAAIQADYTVTFGLPKIGNILYPGFNYCGKLFVSRISFPRSLSDDTGIEVEISVPSQLPERDPKGHKGTFGDVLFIAGAASYYGAPCFSSLSFLKAGGGYARLAAPESVIPHIAAKAAEIVYLPMEETEAGSISMKNFKRLLEIAEKVDLVVMGPGVSTHSETSTLVRKLVSDIEKPILIDGDGLTAIAEDTEIVRKRKGQTILTPHPGEMARITGLTVHEIIEQEIRIVQDTAEKLEAYIVLKGAHSLIGTPHRLISINLSGNSGMGTAGSGDVLTGTIAAMYGLGYPIPDAVKAGVFIHGLAGDIAACNKGEDGMTASDIMEDLTSALSYYRKEYALLMKDYYKKIFLL
jgi:hydroxyethylthiazole kinase-like uncharacterized protein yjeF